MKVRSLITHYLISIIFILCTEIFISCIKDEVIENRMPATFQTRSFSCSSIPTDFFAYSNPVLDSIITTLKAVEEEQKYTESFQQEYGIPLWDYTYIIEGKETLFFVPLFCEQTPLEINSIWMIRLSNGHMKYAPLNREDPSIAYSEQRFLFDLLSYLVFGEENSTGYIFIATQTQTRSWITVTRCWDVYTGTAGNLEYSYSNCIDNTYWIDDAPIWNYKIDWGGGGGDLPLNDGGGTGNGSSSSSASVFKNDKLSADTWTVLDRMLKEILEDCMGENLYNSIKKQLNGDKITIQIVDGAGSSYNWNTKTLSLDVNRLESNIYLHELLHLYQTLQESNFTFENSMMNREIEAHYAQYVFLKKQSAWEETYKEIYKRNQRGNAMIYLDLFYLDKHANLKNEITLELFECYVSQNVVSAFRNEEAYKDYPFNFSQESLQLFSNINTLTKNCE